MTDFMSYPSTGSGTETGVRMVSFFAPTDYTIRVELERVDPLVWRRLRIASDLSLPLFARVLEAATGWHSYPLHQFVSGT